MRYLSVAEMAKKWNIPEPERSNKKKKEPVTLLEILQNEKKRNYSGGIYHKTQIDHV